jgi:hypothetical protein
MSERASPWKYNLRACAPAENPEDLQIDLDLPNYILMAHELADKLENRSEHFPNKLFYIPGSAYLASIVAKNIGIQFSKKIDVMESIESIYVEKTDSITIIANQNVGKLLTTFANDLKLLYQPLSVIVGVLFENAKTKEKADVAVFTTDLRVKFPRLPEIGVVR